MLQRDRHVMFEACFNFRDLGGYETADGRRVRWGLGVSLGLAAPHDPC